MALVSSSPYFLRITVSGGEVFEGGGFATDVFEVVVEFLDFQQVEHLLGFEDAVLFEQ